MSSPPTSSARYDVIVIGGGLAAASVGLLLKRLHPGAKVLLTAAQREPAQAACSLPLSPAATLFFSRGLRVDELLAREHLPKDGEVEWFAQSDHDRLGEMTQVGWESWRQGRAYHVDPARLTASLMELAQREGVELARGAEISKLDLAWPENRVRLLDGDGERTASCRWLIDAGGEGALLANDLDLILPIEGPSCWSARANWSGALSIDGPELGGHAPHVQRQRFEFSNRQFASHHFQDRRGRVSCLPNAGGGVSVLLREDARTLVGRDLQTNDLEAYSLRVRSMPGLREILAQASLEADSFQSSRRDRWTLTRPCDRGWFSLGAAAGVWGGDPAAEFERATRDIWGAATTIAEDLRGRLGEGGLMNRLNRHWRHARQADSRAAMDLGDENSSWRGDAALHALRFGFEQFVARWHADRLDRDLAVFDQESRSTEWSQLCRSWVQHRLGSLGRARERAGLLASHNGGRHLKFSDGGKARALARITGLWLSVEWEGLRRLMTPQEDDEHQSPSSEIQRRADQALSRARNSKSG